MDATLRRLRDLIAIALACAVTTLPACGTMSGGGMSTHSGHELLRQRRA
jgi:predicted small secreted protein